MLLLTRVYLFLSSEKCFLRAFLLRFVNMFIWFACEFSIISRSISSFLSFSLSSFLLLFFSLLLSGCLTVYSLSFTVSLIYSISYVFFFPMGGHFCHASRLHVFFLNFSDLHDVFYMDLAWTCLYDPNLSFIIRWPVFFGTILQNIENKCSVFRHKHACILFLLFFLCTCFFFIPTHWISPHSRS